MPKHLKSLHICYPKQNDWQSDEKVLWIWSNSLKTIVKWSHVRMKKKIYNTRYNNMIDLHYYIPENTNEVYLKCFLFMLMLHWQFRRLQWSTLICLSLCFRVSVCRLSIWMSCCLSILLSDNWYKNQ